MAPASCIYPLSNHLCYCFRGEGHTLTEEKVYLLSHYRRLHLQRRPASADYSRGENVSLFPLPHLHGNNVAKSVAKRLTTYNTLYSQSIDSLLYDH